MKADSAKAFGTLLRQQRRQRGLSQDAVANAIGVNRRVIGELEGGKRTVQLQIAVEAARAVGLDLHLVPRR